MQSNNIGIFTNINFEFQIPYFYIWKEIFHNPIRLNTVPIISIKQILLFANVIKKQSYIRDVIKFE